MNKRGKSIGSFGIYSLLGHIGSKRRKCDKVVYGMVLCAKEGRM